MSFLLNGDKMRKRLAQILEESEEREEKSQEKNEKGNKSVISHASPLE